MSCLKALRENAGYKQDRLAELLGISAASYCKKESGMVKFSLPEAKKISDFFSTTIEKIFFAEEVSKNDTSMNEAPHMEDRGALGGGT